MPFAGLGYNVEVRGFLTVGLFAGALAMSCSAGAPPVAPNATPSATVPESNPSEIVKSMMARYAQARTYEDKGTLVSTIIGTTDRAIHRTFERTYFPAETKSDAEILAGFPTEYPEEERQHMLEALRHQSAFVSEATTDYDPVFDADVPENRFAFTPPS
jgi:hypothetical protein